MRSWLAGKPPKESVLKQITPPAEERGPGLNTSGEFKPFVIQTCECRADPEARRFGLAPPKHDILAPFEIHDPFGIRNAIVPVFRKTLDGHMYGMGTAFHLDGFGNFLSAYHVVDFIHDMPQSRPILFLSMHAVVYGTVGIPADCFVPAAQVYASMAEMNDPMAALRGKSERQPAIDVALIAPEPLGPDVRRPQSLPVRLRRWIPVIGEYVLAVGFPQLDLSELNVQKQTALLTEGMQGAYGRIVAIHPDGVSTTNSTPVFEVEGDWPGGMSGGPVFNGAGEVVSMVSRSLRAEGGLPGAGFAVYFAATQDLSYFVKGLDKDNPGWRVGWGLICAESNELLDFFETEKVAQAELGRFDQQIHVRSISNKIGTLEYMEN